MTDWTRIRAQYPITQDKVYLKSASIGGMNVAVLEETSAWQKSIAFEAAIHEHRFGDLVFSSRDKVAAFLNCPADQVTLTENTSHNMNLVAMMLKEECNGEFNQGIEIIAPADEFPSSILPFRHHGHKVIQVASQQGVFSIHDILEAITPQTKAVVCSHIQFATGLRTDIYQLSEELKKRNIAFILNATQSIGVFPIDISKLHLAALSATCHKWLGAGMGRAVFYLSEEFMRNHRSPLLGWCSVAEPFEMSNSPAEARSDVGSFQLGTLPFAQLAAVSKAIEINEEIGTHLIAERVLDLSQNLRGKIKDLGLEVLGLDDRNFCSGTTTFAIDKSADELVEYLESQSIYVNNRRGKIRTSIHFYNNEADIERFIQALKYFLQN